MPNTTAKTCGLHHITIQTRDWEASLRLYRKCSAFSRDVV
jgi:catechol 2,3-dioxygenase-like lactoylglutathione lyase family enzyme